MAKANGSKKQANNEVAKEQKPRQVTKLVGKGLRTEIAVDEAISTIFDDLVSNSYNPDQTRLMLGTVTKKLTLEGLKLRAGVYKVDKNKAGFFLV